MTTENTAVTQAKIQINKLEHTKYQQNQSFNANNNKYEPAYKSIIQRDNKNPCTNADKVQTNTRRYLQSTDMKSRET